MWTRAHTHSLDTSKLCVSRFLSASILSFDTDFTAWNKSSNTKMASRQQLWNHFDAVQHQEQYSDCQCCVTLKSPASTAHYFPHQHLSDPLYLIIASQTTSNIRSSRSNTVKTVKLDLSISSKRSNEYKQSKQLLIFHLSVVWCYELWRNRSQTQEGGFTPHMRYENRQHSHLCPV